MHVAVALAVGVFAFLVLVLLAGLTPFIGVPIAVLVFLAPIAFFAFVGRQAESRRKLDEPGVPSTGEATYEPVVDPSERI
jgi:hypothetical protein